MPSETCETHQGSWRRGSSDNGHGRTGRYGGRPKALEERIVAKAPCLRCRTTYPKDRTNNPSASLLYSSIGDYDKRRTLEVVVDSAGKFVSKTDLTGFQPPIVNDEIAEARKIAEIQPIVAALARAPGGFVQAFGPHAEDAPERRLVGLRYGAMGPRALAEVEVDLAHQNLIRFEDIEARGAEN
jgi:hypothetical protein